MIKDIVILTKSVKLHKYCVAGIEIQTGKWIRLVSYDEESDGALSGEDIKFSNGYQCCPLDVVRVELERAVPKGCQSENYLVSPFKRWVKIGKMSIDEVVSKYHTTKEKWIFGNNASYLSAEYFNYSLVLAEVEDLKVYKNECDKWKADFRYNLQPYTGISMTDPKYFDDFSAESAYIVVSMPHKDYNGHYYKFVAKIFPKTTVKNNIYDGMMSDLLF